MTTRVQGRCPACRMSALFLGDGGYVTCGNLQCPNPCAVTDMLEQQPAARTLEAAAIHDGHIDWQEQP